VLPQDEAIVFKAAVASSQDFHFIVPFIVAVQNGLDEMRLSVGDVQKETILFQNSLDLVLSDTLNLEDDQVGQLTSFMYLPLFSSVSSGGLHGLPKIIASNVPLSKATSMLPVSRSFMSLTSPTW
jgi:hypothetical protein